MTDRFMRAEIWVYCEIKNENLTTGACELLGKASLLAKEANCVVAAVLFKKDQNNAVFDAFSYGADKVYHFPSICGPERQTDEIAYIMEKGRPWAFLFPATITGRMIAAKLSVRLKTGLTADCVDLSVENGFLCQTRPAFGGSLKADVFCRRSLPQMATVQRGVFPMPRKEEGRVGEIVCCPLSRYEDEGIKVLDFSIQSQKVCGLEDARIILSGGLGLGSKEGFALLEQAAEKIGAVAGASRGAVNAGFAPYAWQIGQSGKIVRPTIYIACGISGAVQHLAGIQGAGYIVAVNRDAKAPIFHYADLGIVEDGLLFLRNLLENGK